MPEKLKAISLRQPWAEDVMLGVKSSEYRGTPTKHRGPIYIYASLGSVSSEDVADWEAQHGIAVSSLPRGKIIGTVEIVACQKSKEYAGRFEWVLANPQRLSKPLAPLERPQPVWFHPFGKPRS